MSERPAELQQLLENLSGALEKGLSRHDPGPSSREVGTVAFVGPGIVRVSGLRGVRSRELIRFPGDRLGMAFNVDEAEIGVVLLDETGDLEAGSEARRTRRVPEIPVGPALLGRVVDGQGRPQDGRGPLRTDRSLPLERPAPAIMDRLPVTEPLQTGLKVVDALIPIGRGQRELIVGDRQTGKTAIAVDAMLNQKDTGVICIYCSVGKRASAVAKVIDDLRTHDAMDRSIVLVATEEDPPGMQFLTPYAAASLGEHFMENGRDVVVVLDDLTRHARAYRELSLLLRRPPGREAFPGDIFYIHSRLLERFTHLREEGGGGSLTALPIVETEAQNISAYIPTNLISITDGQIYLSPELFRKGVLPAVDVGKSVSRVGGKTQLKAYRSVSGELRLAYSQFEELEAFARFGTQMDDETRKTLERGRRVREVLKQPQYAPLPVPRQIAALVAVKEGVFDGLSEGEVAEAEARVREAASEQQPDLCRRILEGEALEDEDVETLVRTAREAAGAGQEEKSGDD